MLLVPPPSPPARSPGYRADCASARAPIHLVTRPTVTCMPSRCHLDFHFRLPEVGFLPAALVVLDVAGTNQGSNATGGELAHSAACLQLPADRGNLLQQPVCRLQCRHRLFQQPSGAPLAALMQRHRRRQADGASWLPVLRCSRGLAARVCLQARQRMSRGSAATRHGGGYIRLLPTRVARRLRTT